MSSRLASTAELEHGPDAELLRAVAAGNREALALLYRRHAPWIVTRLSRRCRDTGLVDEVTQDTFVAVWRSAGLWDGRGEVAAWMWGIAIRRLADARRRPTVAVAYAEDITQYAAASESSAEDTALRDLRFTSAGQAVNRLPTPLKLVVAATVLNGMTTREASQVLGIPTGTVKTRMMRARQILRQELT